MNISMLKGKIVFFFVLTGMILFGMFQNFSFPELKPVPPPSSDPFGYNVGVIYQPGWAQSALTGKGMVKESLKTGEFCGRTPLMGWQESESLTAMKKYIQWANEYGIDFFVFNYFYYKNQNQQKLNSEPLNEPLTNFLNANTSAANKVKFAIQYTNGQIGHNVKNADKDDPNDPWIEQINYWIETHIKRPDYLLVDDKPVFFVVAPGEFRKQFGICDGQPNCNKKYTSVNHALKVFSNAVKEATNPQTGQRYPGLHIVVMAHPAGNFDNALADLQTEGYTSVTSYGPGDLGVPDCIAGEEGSIERPVKPYDLLIESSKKRWSEFLTSKNALTFIPTVLSGYDNRPWRLEPENQDKKCMFKSDGQSLETLGMSGSNPLDLKRSLTEAKNLIDTHRNAPASNRNKVLGKNMVLISAWNELGIGSYILPTIGTKHACGDENIPGSLVDSNDPYYFRSLRQIQSVFNKNWKQRISESDSPTSIPVYIFAGQSNAMGPIQNLENLFSPLNSTNILFAYNLGSKATEANNQPDGVKCGVVTNPSLISTLAPSPWIGCEGPTAPPTDQSPDLLGKIIGQIRSGPEVMFAHKMQLDRKQPILILKFAIGGTSLIDDWSLPASDPKSIRLQMVKFISSVQSELAEAGITPEYKGLFWLQGESDIDAVDTQVEGLYQQKLTELVSRLRQLTKNSQLPVVVAQTAKNSATQDKPAIDAIRNAQSSFVANDPNAAIFSIDDLAPNGVHFQIHSPADPTVNQYDIIGNRFFGRFKERFQKEM